MRSLDLKNIRLFGLFRFKKNAEIRVEGSGGEESVIAAHELASLSSSSRLVTVTEAALTINKENHAGKIIKLDRAAGITVTLPDAVGSGDRYEFFISTTITSNTTTIAVANGSDTMVGSAINGQDAANTAVMFEASGIDDTITLNGTTTGGVVGDSIELVDIADNLWLVKVVGSATGVELTPFSATVAGLE